MWLSTPVYCCTLVKINTMLVTPICPVLVFRAIQAIGTSLCIGNPVVVIYGSDRSSQFSWLSGAL